MMISILVIDPKINIEGLLCSALKGEGCLLTCVNDRKSLIQILPRVNPRVIIMDPFLEEDADSAVSLFCELAETCLHSEFILISSHNNVDLLLAALKHQIAKYFEKPVSDAEIFTVVKQVIAKMQERENLIQSEQYYKTIVQSAPDTILLLDRIGTILEINRAFAGRQPFELVGSALESHLLEDTIDGFQQAFAGVLQTGRLQHCEFRVIHPIDHRLLWFEASMAPVRFEEHITEISAILRDITANKKTFFQIQHQRNELRALYEVGRQVSATLNLKEIFDFAYFKIAATMASNSFFLSSFDPETKLIRAEYSRHEGNYVDVTVYPPLPLNPEGNGTQSRVILSGEAMILNDYQATLKTSKKKLIFDDDGKIVDAKDVPEDGDVMRSAIIIPIKLNAQVVGVIQVFSTRKDEYDEEDLHFLEAVSSQVAVASNNASLFRQLQTELDTRKRAEKELEQAYNQTLLGWVNALEIREQETAGHSIRVTDLMMKLADQYSFSEHGRLQLWRGALLHDIGKLVIPAEILLKNGSMDDREWAVMRQHGEYAYEWLSSIDYLKEALEIPRYHHEKWNGEGYPLGLSGTEIPLCARMFAVIDVYDALMNKRPYREAWPPEKVLAYLREESGKHFDPDVVEKFLLLISSPLNSQDG